MILQVVARATASHADVGLWLIGNSEGHRELHPNLASRKHLIKGQLGEANGSGVFGGLRRHFAINLTTDELESLFGPEDPQLTRALVLRAGPRALLGLRRER